MVLSACAIGVLRAVPLHAQFTAAVAPPPARVEPAVVAPTIAERRDSVGRATMTDMREWVDSAAATLGVRADTVAVDSAAGVVVPPPLPAVQADPEIREPTVAFREGAPAPDTATVLPLLGLSGGLLLAVGLWLLRRRECAESSARS
jgi:LPXTG-motif cell wall-anchored protein